MTINSAFANDVSIFHSNRETRFNVLKKQIFYSFQVLINTEERVVPFILFLCVFNCITFSLYHEVIFSLFMRHWLGTLKGENARCKRLTKYSFQPTRSEEILGAIEN